MKKNLKNLIIVLVSFVMVTTSVVIGCLFINKNDGNGNNNNNGTENINNIIYYASPTEATGASEASKEVKGAIYVESGATFTLSDEAEISGNDAGIGFGGAVYVAAGGTFNMTGGKITGNNAKYGGAIFVENGGVCNITGGTISENTAELGTAIYVQDGGKVNLSSNFEIKNNIEGEWGYLKFGDDKYRDFAHFYEFYDTIDPESYTEFNYEIYGTVYQEYKDINSGGAYRNGLNFGKPKPVNFIGCYDNNITDTNNDGVLENSEKTGDEPTIFATGIYQSVVFNTEGSNLTFDQLIFKDESEQTSSWETWYFKPRCNNLKITKCVFEEGLNICEVGSETDASSEVGNVTIDDTTFNSNPDHYSLWIGANGLKSYGSIKDTIETCKITNCTFTGCRGIKLLSGVPDTEINDLDGTDIYLKNVDFIGMSEKYAIVAKDINNSDAVNNLHLSGVNIKNCSKGFIDTVTALEHESESIGILNSEGYFDVAGITLRIYLDDYTPESEKEFVTNDLYVVKQSSAVNFYENDEQTGFWYFYNKDTNYSYEYFSDKLYIVSKVAGDKWGNTSLYNYNYKNILFSINEVTQSFNYENNNIYYASAEEINNGSEMSSATQGGKLYVGSGEVKTMEIGRWTGGIAEYGGAVYVADGGTFEMNGGTITGNNAKYGGAIYVAAGGVCNINGGTIEGNKAEIGTAIYVEDGGTLNIADNITITGNIEGAWGYIEFNGVKYRNFEDIYAIYNTINSDDYSEFNYNIYGRVFHSFNTLSDFYSKGLNFRTEEEIDNGTGKNVIFTGIFNENITFDEAVNTGVAPTIVAAGIYQSAVLNTEGSDLNFTNIVFDDIRTSDADMSWEVMYFKLKCNNLKITKCVFNEGLNICEVVNADISGTTFNSNPDHYSLWIGANGRGAYDDMHDYLEYCTITDCIFTGCRALKVLSNGAEIVLDNVKFNGLTEKHAIVAKDINIDGVYNKYTFSNVSVENCDKGFVDVGDPGVLSGNFIQYYYKCGLCEYKGVGFISGHDFPASCPNPDCIWPECPTCGHINNREDTSCEECNYPNEEPCDYCGSFLYADGSCSYCDQKTCDYCYEGYLVDGDCSFCDQRNCPHCYEGYLVHDECSNFGSDCYYPEVIWKCNGCYGTLWETTYYGKKPPADCEFCDTETTFFCVCHGQSPYSNEEEE